jgi:hypothetical protein
MTQRPTPPHTPGPWSLDEATGEVVDSLGTRIAKLPVGTVEERANARMIAASPLLLDTLRELLSQVEWSYLGSADCLVAAIQRASLALVSANEGQEAPEDLED